ncbi:DoxX family protein [Desmospora activa]|uniref:Putative membrane protein YphA (DoxX/SURF4 family) n=1 Tax=Desmospora activa DSM 45169 TaxID=1121389 RepID=A0A2T4ZAX0_9BACL|nr:DoxX family protein [Desmospora activa]PTM59038.1 putative membrane protein YphA (DoxX/SURF4 family) [Desmospora activa DSM 45169]
MKNGSEWGTLILRLALGVLFLVHGWDKFQNGLDGTAGFFVSVGIPGFFATVVAVVELLGGLLMIVGLATRVVAILFAVVMVVAIATVKWGAGFLGGYELDLVLLAMSIHLFLVGGGTYALDTLFRKRNDASSAKAKA